MTSVNNTIDPQVVSALKGPSGASSMDKTGEELRNNFMTLLVTQLQNQDPTEPLKNSELTSHLAQINTVSGIDALNDTLDGITEQIETGQSLQAAGLIGKGVLVPGNRLLVGSEGVTTPVGVELDSPARSLTFDVVGSDGQVVHSRVLESVPAGVQSMRWDGKLASGETAPAGAYQVVVEATNSGGEAVSAGVLSYAMVNGVSTSGNGGVRLDLGGVSEQVRLDDVRQIL